MEKRLTFKADTIKEIMATFDTMYAPDKLYDYSQYITMYGDGKKVYFEMCVILDGASSDSMVRLWENMESEPFEPLVINFKELRTITKSFKDGTVLFDITGKNLTIKYNKTTHTAELSTVTIPRQIREVLDKFFTSENKNLLDFNLLKLYNNMNDIGSNLTLNTLSSQLYGIMSADDFLVSTDGFSMRIYLGAHLPSQFMFPKHSLKILKMLPKLGAKCSIIDHRIYISGAGYQCYIGEWSGGVDYPVKAIKGLIDKDMQKVNDAQSVLNAINECHRFSDLAVINFSKGTVTNENGTHIECFEPTADIADTECYIHKTIINGIIEADEFYVDTSSYMYKVIHASRINILMGVKRNE